MSSYTKIYNCKKEEYSHTQQIPTNNCYNVVILYIVLFGYALSTWLYTINLNFLTKQESNNHNKILNKA